MDCKLSFDARKLLEMKLHKGLAGIGILAATIFFSSCGTSKIMVDPSVAQQQAASGNYAEAVLSWTQYFNDQLTKGNEVSGDLYAAAAKTALLAEQSSQAETWFEAAKTNSYSDEEMSLALAKIYRDNNDVRQEMSQLEAFQKAYPQSEQLNEVNARLFELYYTVRDYDMVKATWPALSEEAQNNKTYVADYFNVVLKSNDAETIEPVALHLVEVDPEHVKAMEWLGETYYRRAEDSYQEEMKAYEKNHTHMQHLHLTQQLKVINADFKKAEDFFLKLWEKEQKSSYAIYLTNIYTRFSNKEKADYYRKFIKQ